MPNLMECPAGKRPPDAGATNAASAASTDPRGHCGTARTTPAGHPMHTALVHTALTRRMHACQGLVLGPCPPPATGEQAASGAGALPGRLAGRPLRLSSMPMSTQSSRCELAAATNDPGGRHNPEGPRVTSHLRETSHSLLAPECSVHTHLRLWMPPAAGHAGKAAGETAARPGTFLRAPRRPLG